MNFQNCLMLILISRIECILLFRKIFWVTRQSIQLIIDLVEIISDVIVEFKQKFTSISLMMIQLLNWHEILKIFVIQNHLNRIDKVFKLWLSFLKCINNVYKFFIINFVVTLDWVMLLWKVSDWMKNFVLIILKENVFEYIVWSIDFYHNLVIWITMMKNNLKSEDFLKNVECNLTFLKLNKEYIFSDETSKQSSYFTIVINESFIKVREI